MSYNNRMNLKFLSLNENESFARLAVASFCSNLNLTIEEISDIKTAVSEAVTNCVVHGYINDIGWIEISCEITDEFILIKISDSGVGIEDIEQAKKPFYTSLPEKERSGMGFTVMESFMDEMMVESKKGEGTTVTLIKKLHNK